MERSGPDDARDDAHDPSWDGATGGTGPPRPPHHGGPFGSDDDADADDLDYPPAPIPPHERTWRHPSEIGEAAWARTEPPVAIGRGLLVTSGAIGSALGVAVLYLMLPAGGSSPAATPLATTSSALRAPVVTIADPAVAQIVAEPFSPPGWMDHPDVTLPAADTPSTVLVVPSGADGDEPGDVVSVAVAIDGAPYMLTTANAMASIDGGTDGLRLLGPDGRDGPADERWLDADLVAIEGDLAYLAPSVEFSQIEVVSFATTAAADHGDTVTVLADDPMEIEYAVGEGIDRLDADVIVEGTPVVDASGALVALCTVVIDADGARVDLVPVEGAGPDTGSTDGATTTESSDPTASDPTATGPTTSDPSMTGGTGSSPAATGSSTSVATTGTAADPASIGAASGGTAPAASGAPSGSVWIGLTFDTSPAAAPLTVAAVVAGSPASSAGIVPGERIVAIDGVVVTRIDDVLAALRTRRAGDTVKLLLATRPAGPATAPTATSTAAAPATSTVPGAAAPAGAAAVTTTTLPSNAPAGTAGSTPGTSAGTRVVSVVLGAVVPGV